MKMSIKKKQDQMPHFFEAMHHRDPYANFLTPSPESYWGWGVFFDATIGGCAEVILSDPKKRAFFRQCTKLENPPDKPVREVYCLSAAEAEKVFTLPARQ